MSAERRDVVVIGGAFSGSATALLLRRRMPEASVTIVEDAERFDRKVGEATVEISAFFLAHVLRLHDLLAREQLPKHGLRYWFTDGRGRRLDEMTEVGADLVPSLPSFQLDRADLDESLLALAAREGTELLRPARVVSVDLGRPASTVVVEHDGRRRELRARWVVDASGRRAFLARKLKLLRRNDAHPTSAAWGRWHGVADLDGARGPAAGLRSIPASRRLCTNHFCGHGWWCWLIPLAGGETSVGVVWDERFAQPLGSATPADPRERFERFLRSQDGLRELLEGARLDETDFRTRRHLAYCTTRYAGVGWALVGDAASFLDPYYSPGLDHCSISAYATARLVADDLCGRLEPDELERAVAQHDERFLRSYERSFQALYEDKYELFGEADLVAASFMLDTAMYYLGVVHPVYADADALHLPVLGLDDWRADLAHASMRFQRRRMVSLARSRRARGTDGRRNAGTPFAVRGFGDASLTFSRSHRRGLALWLRAELREIRERLFGARAAPASAARPASAFGQERG